MPKMDNEAAGSHIRILVLWIGTDINRATRIPAQPCDRQARPLFHPFREGLKSAGLQAGRSVAEGTKLWNTSLG